MRLLPLFLIPFLAVFAEKPSPKPKVSEKSAEKPVAAPAQTASPKTEVRTKAAPACFILEPAALATKAAEKIVGAKNTVWSKAAERSVGDARVLDAEGVTAGGMDAAGFREKALAAAAAHLKQLQPEFSRDASGVASYALLVSDCPFHTSILLCPEFGVLFEKEFGKDLIVLAPDRFSVYVFSRTTGDFQQYAERLATLHQEATFPASAEAFQWSAEGLKAIGALGVRK
jgi:hypothetical protein